MTPRMTRRGMSSTEYVIVVVLGAMAILLAVAQFGATLQDETIASDASLFVELQP